MPTILRIDGYRFFFYSNESNEPLHIHIEKGDAIAKVWLDPEILPVYFINYTKKEERDIMKVISLNIVILKEKWHEYFDK